jgi:cation diffusion facilitator CzcD-associated flavoprotein CzcO
MTFSPTSEPVDVLVVGAGITGLYQLHRALEEGFTAELVEAGDGVGGTWFWNRYPGARFDSESYTYGYLFSRELFDEWEWQEHFAGQPEIERYLNHVVDRFDLRRHLRLHSPVTSAVWDDASAAWTVTTGDGAVTRARFLVAATGVLSVPYIPDVPGRDDFRGVQHHTGRWPAEPVDMVGKRVAVIGTSSSGVQVVPAIADEAAEVTVYQRSANWCTPLNNRPITPAEQAQLRTDFEQLREVLATSIHGFAHPMNPKSAFDDPPDERQAFFDEMWASPGFMKFTSNYIDILDNPEANAEWCEFIAGKIRAAVHDPDTAERLIPKDHRYGEKRPPYVTGYFEAFNRPNVELVDLRDTPIVRVTEHGIECPAYERQHDVIVWATGFDFGTGAMLRMGIVGRDGVALTDHWADGPTTFLGLQTAGFPNLFTITGPGSPSVLSNMIVSIEQHVEWVADCVDYLRERNIRSIEPTIDAQEAWVEHVNEVGHTTLYPRANSWYMGANIPGKPRVFMPYIGGVGTYRQKCDEIAAAGYTGFTLTP